MIVVSGDDFEHLCDVAEIYDPQKVEITFTPALLAYGTFLRNYTNILQSTVERLSRGSEGFSPGDLIDEEIEAQNRIKAIGDNAENCLLMLGEKVAIFAGGCITGLAFETTREASMEHGQRYYCGILKEGSVLSYDEQAHLLDTRAIYPVFQRIEPAALKPGAFVERTVFSTENTRSIEEATVCLASLYRRHISTLG